MKVRRPGAVERAKRMRQAGQACARHKRGDLAGWLPIDNEQGTHWAIAEVHRCTRCGLDMDPRIARGTIKRTQREAMVAYGLPQATIDGFFPPAPTAAPAPVKPGEAVTVPLTSWPFPVSTHYPKPAAPAQPHSRRRQRAPIVIA